MGCACNKKRKAQSFIWYDPANPEGVEPMVYDSKMKADAKVYRKGGTYIPYDPNLGVGAQIALAEAAKV